MQASRLPTLGPKRLDLPEDDRDRWIRAMLENWGDWARGRHFLGIKGGSTSTRPTPIERQAEEIERVMCLCKQRRRELYAVAFERYVIKSLDYVAAKKLKISVTLYYKRLSRVTVYVDGVLERLDSPI